MNFRAACLILLAAAPAARPEDGALARFRAGLPARLAAAKDRPARDEIVRSARVFCREKGRETSACAAAMAADFIAHARTLKARTPDESRLKGSFYLYGAEFYSMDRAAYGKMIVLTCKSALERFLDPLDGARVYRLWVRAIEPADGAPPEDRAGYRDEALKLKFASLRRVLDRLRVGSPSTGKGLSDERQILLQEISWLYANPPEGVSASPEGIGPMAAAALGPRHREDAERLAAMTRREFEISQRRENPYRMRSPQDSVPAFQVVPQ